MNNRSKWILIFTAILVIAVLLLVMILLAVYWSDQVEKEVITTHDVCTSKECQAAAKRLHLAMNTSIDPCDDFYLFSCGAFIAANPVDDDTNEVRNFDMPDKTIEKRIEDLLTDIDSIMDGTSKPFEDAKMFFNQCNSADFDEDEDGRKLSLRLLRHTKAMGGWPITNSSWTESDFDLEAILIYLRKNFWLDALISIERKDENGTMTFDISLENFYSDYGRLMFVIEDEAKQFQENTVNATIVNAIAMFISKKLRRNSTRLAQIEKDIWSVVELVNEFSSFAYAAANPEEDDGDDSGNGSGDDVNSTTTSSAEMTTEITSTSEGSVNDTDGEDADEKEEIWRGTVDDLKNLSLPIDLHKVIVKSFEPINTSGIIITISNLDLITNVTQLLNKTEKRTIANYLIWRFMYEYTSLVKDCKRVTKQAFAHAIGRAYVYKYLNNEMMSDIELMVQRLRDAFRILLNANQWMDAETKAAAQEKLEAIKENIGFPNWYTDLSTIEEFYQDLNISEGEGALKFMNNFEKTQRWLSYKMKTPEKHGEIFTLFKNGVIVNNAFYFPSMNDMVVLAGILTEPFYQSELPPAVNYGALGYIIGHELTHAFDGTGKFFDASGELKEWWSNNSTKEFEKRENCFLHQYAQLVEDADVITAYSKYTLDENMADGGGIREAFKAFEEFMKLHPRVASTRLPDEMVKYSPKKLFFISFANALCATLEPKTKLLYKYTDQHSLDQFRVLGSLMNSHEFSNTFKCSSGSRMNTERKCSIISRR